MPGTRPPSRTWLREPPGRPARLHYGADYNPDQWPRRVWDEDVRLMREAGVTVVSLAIFSWARIQPRPDEWDFAWLDDVMDLMQTNGIAVDLATATASPPPWLATSHPEILPVTRAGERLWPGGRQHWRPTSPVFREHALRLVEAMATRYADHEALVAWHVSNELGCHNAYDFSDDAARAFRTWLEERYGSLDRLNDAWGTAFWSQRYSAWAEILPPRIAPTFSNPTQQLDFERFSSDALKDHLRAEREALRRITPDVPVTTNFMVMGERKGVDFADWGTEVDFVSNDHYALPGPDGRDELSFSANLTSGIARGRPWFLMEQSTSAVNWRPVNVPKQQGEMVRDSLTHVAHGADAVCFFQWRQSVAGSEKYHSAMLPHAGPDSDVFREVVRLGHLLGELGEVAGSARLRAPAAILFDWTSWWVSEHDSHPTERLRYKAEAMAWYQAFLDLGVRVDVVPVGTALQDYDVVVAPVLHVVPGGLAGELTRYVARGGHLVTTYFSGVVDENDHVWPGAAPGALRALLGIRVQEFAPLQDGETVELDDGTVGAVWTDKLDVLDPEVEVLARYRTGPQVDRAAVTLRREGAGTATYVSTRLLGDGRTVTLRSVLDRAGVRSDLPRDARGKVELVGRSGPSGRYWFLVNRTEHSVDLADLPGEVLARSEGAPDRGDRLVVGPREVVVLRATGRAPS